MLSELSDRFVWYTARKVILKRKKEENSRKKRNAEPKHSKNKQYRSIEYREVNICNARFYLRPALRRRYKSDLRRVSVTFSLSRDKQ